MTALFETQHRAAAKASLLGVGEKVGPPFREGLWRDPKFQVDSSSQRMGNQVRQHAQGLPHVLQTLDMHAIAPVAINHLLALSSVLKPKSSPAPVKSVTGPWVKVLKSQQSRFSLVLKLLPNCLRKQFRWHLFSLARLVSGAHLSADLLQDEKIAPVACTES